MHKLSVGLIGGGIVALVLSILVGWLAFPHVVNSIVKKSSRLANGSRNYEVWSHPGDSVDVYLRFYVFNVTNPGLVVNGSKPNLVEMGPYVYRENRTKEGIKEGEQKGTLQYREKTYYVFQPQLSTGKDSDMVTFVNIPYVAVVAQAFMLADSDFILEELDSQLMEAGERLLKTTTVRELLFTGFSVKPYIDILTDPIVQIAVGPVEVPPSFNGGTFALYKNKNGSDVGLFEVGTGEESVESYGKIYKWNNRTELPWWKNGSTCNHLGGTDGTMFPPFVDPEKRLDSFSVELCRTIQMEYKENIMFKGIQGLRFSPASETSLSPQRHQLNECFCPPHDAWGCTRNGLLYLSACKDGAPVSVSSPHFHMADHDIIAGVNGVYPDKEKHSTYIDIEPLTGTMMRAAKRLQFNVDVVPVEPMPSYSKVRKMTFPVIWAEEHMELPDNLMKLLTQLKHARERVDTARWSFVGISLICLLLGIMWAVANKDKVDQVKITEPPRKY